MINRNQGETITKSRVEPRAFLPDIGQALALSLVVFLSRYSTRGPVYYVDGPTLVQCIRDHTYVIQPPGYWLFARVGGLFADPAFGLQFMNELFSAVGIGVFFLLCRKMGLDQKMAWAGSICYASIFFVWLAGDIHSSYASQILFAPLLVYLFLCYRDRRTIPRLLACGTCFAIGTGFRPSDGAFLAPLFAFFVLQFVHGWTRKTLLITVTAVLCLAWFLPTQAASRAAHIVPMGTYLSIVRPKSLLLSGMRIESIANIARVILPFLAAFWILLPTLAFTRERFVNRLLAVWIAPGMTFFLLVYMADPVYFSYLAAAVVLLASLSDRQALVTRLLFLCAMVNICLFLFAKPIRGDGRIERALNFYVVKYCSYGIKHRWTGTIGAGTVAP